MGLHFNLTNMKKYINKKFIIAFLIYTAVVKIGTVVAWEMYAEDKFESFINSETITIEREEIETERTRIEELRTSAQAMKAGEECRSDEAKQMRLDEIAEEAKSLQESLK